MSTKIICLTKVPRAAYDWPPEAALQSICTTAFRKGGVP
jgi:hypothetical protein